MQHTLRSSYPAVAALAMTLIACQGGEELRTASSAPAWEFDFDDAPLDGLPAFFTSAVGEWRSVALPAADGASAEGGRGLAQLAENEGPVYNLALSAQPVCADLEVSVRFRAQSGVIDQGGGLVWRAQDTANYYICRYNPLEQNFRIYKVEAGERTQIGSAGLYGGEDWHEISVRCTGDQMRCSYDGRELLDVRDKSFSEPGRVGLWTKADAVTWFDDLRVWPQDAARR